MNFSKLFPSAIVYQGKKSYWIFGAYTFSDTYLMAGKASPRTDDDGNPTRSGYSKEEGVEFFIFPYMRQIWVFGNFIIELVKLRDEIRIATPELSDSAISEEK